MSVPIYFAGAAATVEQQGGIFIIAIAGQRFAMRPHDLEATAERAERAEREIYKFYASIAPPAPFPAPAKKRRAKGAGS